MTQRGKTMLIKRSDLISASEITDEKLYLTRREFIKAAGAISLAAGLGIGINKNTLASPLQNLLKSKLSSSEPLTPLEGITTYNNFY
jgi:sulfoxide reductase catalytic subunit YedY